MTLPTARVQPSRWYKLSLISGVFGDDAGRKQPPVVIDFKDDRNGRLKFSGNLFTGFSYKDERRHAAVSLSVIFRNNFQIIFQFACKLSNVLLTKAVKRWETSLKDQVVRVEKNGDRRLATSTRLVRCSPCKIFQGSRLYYLYVYPIALIQKHTRQYGSYV